MQSQTRALLKDIYVKSCVTGRLSAQVVEFPGGDAGAACEELRRNGLVRYAYPDGSGKKVKAVLSSEGESLASTMRF